MRRVLLTALGLLASLAGCGAVGGSDDSDPVALTVTRDFGAKTVLGISEPASGETVMRLLQRNADVQTRYGGRFATAINGVRSGTSGGRRSDWFYYVNGIEQSVGAADKELHGGDSVWWDYRDWSTAMRVPAVVGSFPEPFLHGAEGKRYPVRIDCANDSAGTCRDVADRLDRVGVPASITAIGVPAGEDVLRLVVGRWVDVRRDPAARQIEEGPAESGVFARIRASGESGELELLDAGGGVVRRVGAGAGLVAATRFREQQPTWAVTGTDREGLERATRLLDARLLRDRYAAAVDSRGPTALPVR